METEKPEKNDLMRRFYKQQAEAEREEEDQRTAKVKALQHTIMVQDTLRIQAALQLQYLEQSHNTPSKLEFTFPAAVTVPRAPSPAKTEVVIEKLPSIAEIEDANQSIAVRPRAHTGNRSSSWSHLSQKSDHPILQDRRRYSGSGQMSQSMPLLPVTEKVEDAAPKQAFNLPSALNGFLKDQGTKLGITANSQEASGSCSVSEMEHRARVS